MNVAALIASIVWFVGFVLTGAMLREHNEDYLRENFVSSGVVVCIALMSTMMSALWPVTWTYLLSNGDRS